MIDTLFQHWTDVKTTNFLNRDSGDEYREQIEKAVSLVLGFLNNEQFLSGESAEFYHSLKNELALNPHENVSLEAALSVLKESFLDHTVAYHHPNYVAHLNCPVLLPALVGDVISGSVNTAIETWDQATTGVYIEKEVIQWTGATLGMKADFDGIFTTGGTQSNLMALLMIRDHYALTKFNWNAKEKGWNPEISKFRVFCSEKAHYSFRKNAALLGMGYESVVPVKTDDRFRMDVQELKNAIEYEKSQGNIPVAVVATLGTTDFGSFDPLKKIAEITGENELWLHVDGAYGGFFALADQFESRFEGMEQADSLTVDFHKSLFQPLCASAFLLKEPECFKYVSYYADYLNPLENKNDLTPDLVEKSLQTTRRFDALKVWLSLKVVGEKKLGEYLLRVHEIIQETYHRAKLDPNLEFIHEPELSTLVFRFVFQNQEDENCPDMVNKFIRSSLFNEGAASVASTRVDGKLYLKFTLLNPESSADHLLGILGLIKQKGFEYQQKN